MFAGEMKVERGVIKVITNKSGHYKPGELPTLKMLELLLANNVDLSSVKCIFIDEHAQKHEHADSMEFLRGLRQKFGGDRRAYRHARRSRRRKKRSEKE